MYNGKRRLIAAVIVSALLLLLSAIAVAARGANAPASQTPNTIGFFQAVLVAFGYFLTNSAFTPNLGFNFFRWPLAAGPIVGLIMGDLGQGILIGATINLVFLGVISAGGSSPADPSLAGWLGTALALNAHLAPTEAITIAAPLGFIGTIGFFSRMSVDITFVHWADDRAEKGDIAGVALMNWLPGQLYVFATTFFTVLL
jgi:PTS system mannose-specific IIC component